MTLLRFGLQDRLNQILSNSVKEGALLKKKKGLKKLNSKYPLVMRGFYWANLARQNLARHLGINSLSKDIAFGSVQPVYQKEVLKN